jgi:hypothetical protein
VGENTPKLSEEKNDDAEEEQQIGVSFGNPHLEPSSVTGALFAPPLPPRLFAASMLAL